MERGVLYIAFGESYREQARRSAQRVAELSEWPICVFTDEEPDDETVFDEVRVGTDPTDWRETRYGGSVKPTYFPRSPFDRTVYLDTDTYIVDDSALDDLFALLDQYELAAAHDTARNARHQYGEMTIPEETTPRSFPWLNTGVVAFRMTDNVAAMFDDWKVHYQAQSESLRGINDQSSFAEALYASNVTHTVLPPEYNHRVPFQQTLVGPIKIIHGHTTSLPEVAATVNDNIRSPDGRTEYEPYPVQSIAHYMYTAPDCERIISAELRPSLRDRLRLALARIGRYGHQMRERWWR